MSTNQSDKKAYRDIVKATSVFGGVQVFNILIGIVRSKIIAILLGPEGMGISGLLQSATSLITGLTSMGLGSSAVKDVAQANTTGDSHKIGSTIATFKKLIWITGLLGIAVTVILSPLLSQWTFGNKDFTLAFVFLSVTLLLQQLTNGNNVVMQGMRKINHLAKSGVVGSTLGLLISIPIYYYFGIQGIVPTIILTSISTVITTWYFARKTPIEKAKVTYTEAFTKGKGMMKLGIAMSANSVLVLGIAYILRIFIEREGGIVAVGLFTAGWAVINTYTGLIFTSMSTDYFPRLAAVNDDNAKGNEVINQQAEIAVLIMSPLIVLFLLFVPAIVTILYSSKFIGINGYMEWALLGMSFKAVSWAIAYQFIAKGDSKLFFINELIANLYILILNIIGYKLYGFNGLGISFTISYIIYALQVYFIARKKYNYRLSLKISRCMLIHTPLIIAVFLSIRLIDGFLGYSLGGIFALISLILAYKELNSLLDIKQILSKHLLKR
ncbi:MAG: O-antigen translocase [Rikenellaceae bacterium]